MLKMSGNGKIVGIAITYGIISLTGTSNCNSDSCKCTYLHAVEKTESIVWHQIIIPQALNSNNGI